MRPHPTVLTPDEVVNVPHAVVDVGDGRWPPIVDPKLLIVRMWREQRELRALVAALADQRELRALVAALADEVNAVEATLGVNPHGAYRTVADRLTAIEQRLDALTTP